MKKNRNEQKLTLNTLKVARLNNFHLINGGSYQIQAFDDDGTDTEGNGPDGSPPPKPKCVTSFPIDNING